ncbi:L-threonine ammonia-lyase [Modicisalibacter ilicicola DSM 19980]|uniref:L-threonine ammonia-lyase n=1 Tax=Modicisalibacter ilicicola DSM 19980 TaxID=1121942 RepID=A0A1M5A3L8_9GAMM|nr:threonine/serine dehydratase [Halomonas ilicicola]SHF24868.1 L-threonine ammonia-lyase [Halomonas ilicicola DSM 19980]
MLTLDTLRQARATLGDTLEATPLVTAHALTDSLACRVRLKAELFQRTGSFKPRGALNWVRTASQEELSKGLGAVSAGNHALGLAWAARSVGARATIVMPADASPFKTQGARALGAEVILHGDINDAWTLMHQLVKERGLTLVHPYDDLRIIAGQGSVGLEILEQAPEAATIVCPIGGGGLISGIGVVVDALRPDIRLIGVEPEGAASMREAWKQGGPHRLERVHTCAKSLGAALVGEYTYRLCRRHVDELVTVNEDGIAQALQHLLSQAKLFAEPGAAVGMAALLEGAIDLPDTGDVVVVVTGGNMDRGELDTLWRPDP